MSATTADKLMTTEELLALPDDGMERWLINGVLHEKYPEVIGGKPMPVRNKVHSITMGKIATLLGIYVDSLSPPRGEMIVGEAGVLLRRNPDVTVGVDVAYISAAVAVRESDDTRLVDGIPTLAIEILSPSDIQEDIHDKIKTYLGAGVPLVWIVDPYDRTVRVYRPDAQPQLFNAQQELSAEPYLPGFRAPVARFFV